MGKKKKQPQQPHVASCAAGIDDAGAQALLETLRADAQLTDVYVEKGAAAAVGAELLQRIRGQAAVNELLKFERLGMVEDVRSLHNRALGDAGIQAVCGFLEEPDPPPAPRLIHLGLSKNCIGRPGRAALLRALLSDAPRVRALRRLQAYCNCKSPEWGELAAEMMAGTPLQEIDIGGNGLGDEGALVLADAFRTGRCKSIKELHLDYNEIGEAGAAALASSVALCEPLCRLWLHGNTGISEATTAAMQQALADNSKRLVAKEGLGQNAPEHFQMSLEHRLARMCSGSVPPGKGDSLSAQPCRGEPSSPSADEVAQLALGEYARVCGDHARRGQVVLASFVQVDPDGRRSVVAFGTGTRFMDPKVVALDAGCTPAAAGRPIVEDSHAEVLARRALVRYFHAQCLLLRTAGGPEAGAASASIFRRAGAPPSADTPQEQPPALSLRAGYTFHLYTSTAPCGACSTASCRRGVRYGKSCMAGSCSPWQPGEELSCTDKIMDWQRQGVQGGDLAPTIGRVPIGSIVVGRRFGPRCQELLGDKVFGTSLRLESEGAALEEGGDSDASCVWSLGDDAAHVHDGRTGLTPDGNLSCVCMRALGWERRYVCDALGVGPVTTP